MSLDFIQVTDEFIKISAPTSKTLSLNGQSVNLGSIPVETYVSAVEATAGAVTYTAAQMASGLLLRDPNGASRSDTTPTAALLLAGIPALKNDGDTVKCYLVNTADAAEVITLLAGVGVTILNIGQTLAQNEAALILIRRTSSTTVTMYLIGA